MLYHGAQRVKLPNLSKMSRLLSPLAIFLRFQVFQRYMIGDVVFWWKVDSNFGHFAATLKQNLPAPLNILNPSPLLSGGCHINTHHVIL